MADISPTYSINPLDYKGQYDPEKQFLQEVGGVGVFAMDSRSTPEEIQKQSDELTLTEDLKYVNLHRDTVLVDTYKRFIKNRDNKDFDGTDQEAVDAFMSDFAYIDNNLTLGMGDFLIDQSSMSENDKFDAGLLYDRYIRVDSFGKGSRPFIDQAKDVLYSTITDPINAIGLVPGVGLLARGAIGKVAGEAAKQTLLQNFRNSVIGKTSKAFGQTIAKRPVISGAVSGGTWTGVYDIEKQNIEIETGIRKARHDIVGEPEDFNYDSLILSVLSGAGLGGGVGLAAKQIIKHFNKGTYSKVLSKDRSDVSSEELRAEVTKRKNTGEVEFEDINIEESTVVQIPKKSIDDATNSNFETIVFSDDLVPESTNTHPWVNEEGDAITVNIIDTEIAPNNKVASVTLRDTKDVDGVVFTAIPDRKGNLQIEGKQFLSDNNLRNILDDADIQQNIIKSPSGILKTTFNRLLEGSKFEGITAKGLFTADFGMGREAADRLRLSERKLIATGEKIEFLIKKLEAEWETKKNVSFDKATREEMESFVTALTHSNLKTSEQKPIMLNNKPWKEVNNIIDTWKDLIADTSGELLDSGAISKMINDPVTGQNTKINPLWNTIHSNRNQQMYLTNLYAMYTDPEFGPKPLRTRLGDDQYNYVKRHLMGVHDLKPKDAEIIMSGLAQQSDRKTITKSFRELAPKTIDKKLSDKDRKMVDILLGKEVDPRILFASTVYKTKKIVEDFKFKQDLVSIGLRRGPNIKPLLSRSSAGNQWAKIESGNRSLSFTDEELQRLWTKEETTEGVSSFLNNPYENIFIDPDFKKYYDAMNSYYDISSGTLQRMSSSLTFVFNLSHTVLSPTTHMRNLAGGALQNAYNGILPWGSKAWRNAVDGDNNIDGSPTYSVFRKTVPLFFKFSARKTLDAGDEQRILRLIELGTLHNGLKAGVFREAYNGATRSLNPLVNLEKALIEGGKSRGLISKSIDKTAEIYEMSDNINKISAFESEFGWLYKAFGSGQDNESFLQHADMLGVFNARQRLEQGTDNLTTLIEEATALKVNMFTPSYNQLPGWSRALRTLPLGNFIAFPLEITRNYKNSWVLARHELLSKNLRMKSRGGIRAASLAGVSTATVGGIGGLSATINGITESQREALESKELAPTYTYGTNNFYTGDIKNNTLKVMPLGYTDPFSYLSRIATVALSSLNNNEPAELFNSKIADSVADALSVAVEPYVLPAMGPATAIHIIHKITKAIEEEDENVDIDALSRELNKAFTPTLLKDLYKVFLGPKNTRWGTPVDPAWHTVLGWTTGIKPANVDIKSKIGFSFVGLQREKSKNEKEFGRFLNNTNLWESRDYHTEVVEEYKKYLDKRNSIAKKVRNVYGYAKTLGLEHNETFDLMRGTRQSKEATVAGRQKWRANFSTDFVGSVLTKQGYYPMDKLSDDRIRLIISSSSGNEKLIKDLRTLAFDNAGAMEE
tara:strand:+ start:4692 stop:9065 length:4374 start_codon:yes stop_codon:yes gene_type:complete